MKKEKLTKKRENKNTKKQRKKLIILAAVAAFFGAILLVLVRLKQSKKVSEIMVTKVSRGIIAVMGRFSSALPFSLYELFLYIMGLFVIGGIVAIFVLLIRRRWVNSLRVLTSLILTALVVSNVYFVSAGFSYNRYDEYFPTYSPDLTYEEMVALAEYFIDDFNDIANSLDRDSYGCAIMPYSASQLSDKLRQEYKRLSGYNINTYTPKAKVIFSSGLMSEMGISGVFFAPFGEANVNGLVPDYSLPFTMAHEMAHAKGVMREDEANQVSLYITLTSSDPFIRYSGYAKNIYTMLDAVSAFEYGQRVGESNYTRLCNKISPMLDKEYLGSGRFWSSHTKLNDFINKINNLYLKIMGQNEGTGAYLPPDTPVVETPVVDPDTDEPVIDPDTGGPVIEYTPSYNTVQKIFFQAYLEKNL